jgi:alpha-tubulin suppressor-like RCC1 family protein
VTPTLGVDFGRSVPGGITDVRGFRVTSMGTGRLRISGVRLAENRRRVFIVLDDTCSGASLPPGSSCTFRVAFDRSAVGPFSSEQLLVWHNARNGVESVPVRAVGPGPRLAWGWNGVGQLGDGTTADKAVPSSGGPSNVKAMASGAFHDVVLANDGVVWGTGLNHVGQLGDGTTVERHRPVRVATLEPFENVAAGAYHSLALTPGGTVYAWGWNHFGQLGDGTTVNRATPVRVPGLTGVVAIAAGAYHSLALRQDGTVWSWGLNHVGQLGDGTAISRATPVRVAGLTSATSLAGGAFHSLATRADGSAWAWGWNAVGQLGDGTTIDRLRPVRVAGLGDVTMLAAGAYYHSVALTRDGRAWAWGLNHVGQLGDRTTLERHLPVLVAGLTGATSVTGGAFHTLALRDDGSAWAWGWNAYGQLGEGTTFDRHAPVRLAAPTVRSVAAAVIHTQAA